MQLQLPSHQLTILKRDLIIKCVCVCWIITKLLCYNLWLAYRLFPLAPVHDVLQYVPTSVHAIIFWLSLLCMGLLILFPRKKIVVVLLVAELLSCMLDQNRWQPWEYQFLCMLAVFVFIEDEKKRRLSWQLIIVGIYFFSGLSKCSSNFIHNVWQVLLLQQYFGVNHIGIWLSRAGYLIPFIEMFAGIALCFGRTRKMAVWLLCAMHLFNLLVFGPAGLNINAVIWPWNILMPVLLFGLFYKDGIHFFDKVLWRPVYTWVMLLCWWILPWLQLWGLWDKYLSGVLYSGSVEYMYICTDDLPARLHLSSGFVYTAKAIPCADALSVYKWGMQEMNTAPYPEPRVYRSIANAWNKLYPNPTNRFYLVRAGFSMQVKELIVGP